MSDVKDLAYLDYLTGMKYKDIAEKHGVSLSAVKSWAIRDWKKVTEKKLQPDDKKVATKQKKLQPEKEEKKAEALMVKAINRNEELTEKQRLFCVHWIRNKNATIAAKNAGYAPDTAHVEGSRLLKNVKVREYIELFISEVRNNVMIDTSEIVERYMKIAFADMSDFAEWGREWQPVINQFGPVIIKDVEGKPTPLMQEVNTVRFKESNMVDGSLVSQIKQGKDGMSIKLIDQQKAMDWLSKYFTMNPMDKHKIEYDNARLSLEKKKAETNPEDGKLIEILIKKATNDKGK